MPSDPENIAPGQQRRPPGGPQATLPDGLPVALAEGLRRVYADRLRGILLFGSFARGEARLYSDLDALVILDRIDRYAAEVDRTGRLCSDLSLRYKLTISRVFISEEEWRAGDSAFVSNIRAEARPL